MPTKTTSLGNFHVKAQFTGLCNLPLCFQTAGQWSDFKKIFRATVREKLEWRVGALTAEEEMFNRIALRMFVSGDGSQSKHELFPVVLPNSFFGNPGNRPTTWNTVQKHREKISTDPAATYLKGDLL